MGSLDGGTVIRIYGKDLENITACEFTSILSSSERTTTQSIKSSLDEVICISPQLSFLGPHKLSLLHRNTLWIPLSQKFLTFENPIIEFSFSMAQPHAAGDREILVVGSLFDSKLRPQCQVDFTNNSTKLTAASVISSSLVICSGVSSGSEIAEISISFNEVDFLDGNYFADMSHLELKSSSGILSLDNSSLSQEYQSLVRGKAELRNTLDVLVSGMRNVLCDGNHVLSFSLPTTSSLATYCLFDPSHPVTHVKYTTPFNLTCPIPSLPPGKYLSNVLSGQDDILMKIELTCVLQPTIHSVSLRPRSLTDGSHTLIFHGFNLLSSPILFCGLGSQRVLATVDSTSQLFCTFPATHWGIKEFSVLIDSRPIFSVTGCVSESLLDVGGGLHDGDICAEIPTAIQPLQVVRNRSVTTYWPRAGLTDGMTSVQVIADGIHPMTDYTCLFGSMEGVAIVISPNNLVCYSPPSPPSIVELVVKSNETDWVCGEFIFVHRLKIREVSTSSLRRPGEIVFKFVVANLMNLPASISLYCHLGEEVILANRYNETLVTCVSDLPDSLTHIGCGLGSESEMWSNDVTLDLPNSDWSAISFKPTFGSVLGGTPIQISLPTAVASDLLRQEGNFFCRFKDILVTNVSLVSQPTENVYWLTCISPPYLVDRVTLTVEFVSKETGSSLVLSSTMFSFERPSETILSIPDTVMQGLSVVENKATQKIFLQGSNFKDSQFLACVVNQTHSIPARWYSPTLISCEIPAHMTELGSPLVLQTSNNGLDLSQSSTLLKVTHRRISTQISPLRAFSLGGGVVEILFDSQLADDHHPLVECVFASVIVRAYGDDTGNYFCWIPQRPAGLVDLTILLNGGYIDSKVFEFIDLPRVEAISPSVALASFQTSIQIRGQGFSDRMVVRFRLPSGHVHETSCSFVSSTLQCLLIPPADVSQLHIDISANGVDYSESLGVINVIDPLQVLSADIPMVYRTGGAHVTFSVVDVRHLDNVRCVITQSSSHFLVSVDLVYFSPTSISCQLPELPLGDLSVRLTQFNHTISGPHDLTVSPDPVVLDIFPRHIRAGILTSLTIYFGTSGGLPRDLICNLDGVRSPIRMSSLYVGTCLVHPLTYGKFHLSLEHMSGFELLVTPIPWILSSSYPTDVSVNVTTIISSSPSFVRFSSPSCSIPQETFCSRDTEVVTPLFILSNHTPDACEIICQFPSMTHTQHSSIISLFVNGSMDTPYYVNTFPIVVPAVISARLPASATTLGGTLVHIYGTGFVNDGTLRCMFGNQSTLAVYENSNRISCLTPFGAAPGEVSLNIFCSGHLITHSILKFTFLPPVTVSLNRQTVFTLGGTLLKITHPSRGVPMTSTLQCRFTDKFVNAAPMDESTLVCISPPLDYKSVEFSLSSDGVDCSSTITLSVATPPTVLVVDPLTVPSSLPVSFILRLSDPLDNKDLDDFGCLVGEGRGVLSVDGNILQCDIKAPGLDAGVHTLSLHLHGTEIYSSEVVSRLPIVITKVSPLTAISFLTSTITIQSIYPISSYPSAHCCFETDRGQTSFLTPALVASPNSWECRTPLVENNISRVGRIGISGPDGICEMSSFLFSFVSIPPILSITPLSGPLTGGTIVTILLSSSIPTSTKIFCRIGQQSFLAERPDPSRIQCITRATLASQYPIELSANGVEFFSTGYSFDYQLLSYQADTNTSTSSQGTLVFYKLDPDTVVSSLPGIIRVSGSGYSLSTSCVLENSFKLPTTYISETELECETPVHIPGVFPISVANLLTGVRSTQLELSFLDQPPHLLSFSSGGISPLHGPRRGGTSIAIYGIGFRSVTKNLFCHIGQDWIYASIVSDTELKCITPPNSYSGQVLVRIATDDQKFIPGHSLFEYIEDPLLFSVEPRYGTVGALVQIRGKGFLRIPAADYECYFGDSLGEVAVVNDQLTTCIVPELYPGKYLVTLRTNGQQILKSGLSFSYNQQAVLTSISPVNGPALRGNTIVTVMGSGFPSIVDVFCVLGEDFLSVPATVLSDSMIRCRLPSHKPGLVNITIVAEGSRLHAQDNFLEFLYTPDVSVDKISPPFGYTSGGYPVFVFGTNFINTTFLGCKFNDMLSRGVFLSNTSILCLAPSPLGRSEIRTEYVGVDVTLNGVDYSENHIPFLYSEPCDEGWFCPGMTRQLCPNGTYCPRGSRNFTLCSPGFFQPKEGQVTCVSCPVGYICPDHGMSRPVVCPYGQICDTQGLRASGKNCPMGHFCANATKASLASQFLNNTRPGIPNNVWSEEYVTGVVSFDPSLVDWNYTTWPLPAVGKSRTSHPPEPLCDGLPCTPGSTKVIAEAPFPCPIGHYCRTGVSTQFPIPKNFSTPQRCFDGFFCPRGSINPEGSGPCPTGYFCPTQLDAMICPRGHYCPGVGNRGPIECYPGTYNPSEGRSNCTVCPTGHICPGWGSLLPELCPAGFVCSALGLSFPVVLCPAGYICEDGTLTLDPADSIPFRPQPCAAGSFCLGGVSRDIPIPWIPLTPWGAQTPQYCSEGTYCKVGAYEPSGSGQCFRGHYCPPRVAFPIETPIGNFASEEGAVAPTLCFPGTYAPLKAQIDCDPCPAGHSCQNYGTYIPTICSIGSFRSLVDSVTCRLCVTGTYCDEVGAVDISMCLPCPEGRVCGVLGISNLSTSVVCPDGHICGYGTDRTRQFNHLAPAGYHTPVETIPADQYETKCSEGYYCVRGTSRALAQRSKCSVGYYCPNGTSTAAGYEVKCPRVTTSLSGVQQISDCRISDVDVCDKLDYDIRYPMQDLTYYPTFSYSLLDGSGEVVSYDSSVTAVSTTGEIEVTNKIYAVNVSSSSPGWVNQTIEAFRTCPSFGNADPEVKNVVTVIGRNFRDTGINYCRWRRCISANGGELPHRCKNVGTTKDGSDYPKFGTVGNETEITRARFISTTRMECEVPKFYFEYPLVIPSWMKDVCQMYKAETDISADPEVLVYRRECDSLSDEVCQNEPDIGYNVYTTLVIPCTVTEIANSLCSNKPEVGYLFNPCYTTEMTVEVSNDGFHWSGGNDLQEWTVKVTAVPEIKRTTRYVDFVTDPTAAVFTFIRSEYYPDEPEILEMEKEFCLLPRYAEESPREREQGWFALKAQDVAHVHIDTKHLPPDMIYGEHYRFALFMFPSRCDEESCNSNRVRLSPRETLPCKLPAEFSTWFLDSSVPKNVSNNITIIALEDLIFKLEIHILLGLYAPYAPLFENCTIVRIASPSRSRIQDGLPNPTTRILSPYISFENTLVPHQYLFAVAYSRSYADSISYPLNLPPRGSDYKHGRALISYNTSADAVDVPDILDDFATINIGSKFWDAPASTPTETKEIYDAFFETFHGMTQSHDVYTEYFTEILVPYMLYFSNCRTFDSYIPFWLLTEGEECALPNEESMGSGWSRYDYPPLPDQDDITVVGPWAFFQDPIADWCKRGLTCNYEERLDTLDVVPRWFEAATGDVLFTIIRQPLTYGQFAGRSTPYIGPNDAGGQAAFDKLMAVSSDIFIGVMVDRSAADAYPGGCTLGCFPRKLTLDMGYYQLDLLQKRLIYINLIYDEFDKNTSDTHYDLGVNFYPLGYYDLLIFFCFNVEIFIILFAFIGGLSVGSAFLYWLVVRITTGLQNPPELKIYSMFTLVAPPPAAGVTLALIPIVIMTFAAYYLIAGDQMVDPTAPAEGWILDGYQLSYANIGGRLDPEDIVIARAGRLGLSFIFIGWYCCWVGCHIFLPKKVSKREDELALKRDKMAEKEEIWAPTLWKRSNLMFSSVMMALFLVFVVEFSYWGAFGDYIWYVIFLLVVISKFLEALIEHQLREALLCAPLQAAFSVIQSLVTLGAPDFVSFILSYFIELSLCALERVYVDPGLEAFIDFMSDLFEKIVEFLRGILPAFLVKKKKEAHDVDFRKREIDDELGGEDAETVEPILNAFGGVCEDTMALWYTPFLTWLLMQFRTQIGLPELYGIREQDMLYYLYFALVIIFFQVITDILLHSCCELFHGWKIYEYLVYTRYRFLQRETRWKGMETALDECIDESMRTLDQMCFSSQYYLMLTIHTNGILYIVLGMEMMLRAGYNPFSDTALTIILTYLWACYLFLSRFLFWFVIKIKLWKIKHENTAWHLQIEEEDDLDVPGWEDVKGASHDAYLMNQRITSETFRYKFLNYNRAWLIQQLPQLLTPRTLRRSRPYLINQFARIINSRRDDISDDSEGDRDKKFGPVALQASSRNIIRFWLDKARRRLRLKHIVEPLIRRARGAECEQCLSRKQLQVLPSSFPPSSSYLTPQVEYEVDIDQMIQMYENFFPADVEIDQVSFPSSSIPPLLTKEFLLPPVGAMEDLLDAQPTLPHDLHDLHRQEERQEQRHRSLWSPRHRPP
jgi:hypothetical protein